MEKSWMSSQFRNVRFSCFVDFRTKHCIMRQDSKTRLQEEIVRPAERTRFLMRLAEKDIGVLRARLPVLILKAERKATGTPMYHCKPGSSLKVKKRHGTICSLLLSTSMDILRTVNFTNGQ